jgi:hypothetical protein
VQKVKQIEYSTAAASINANQQRIYNNITADTEEEE